MVHIIVEFVHNIYINKFLWGWVANQGKCNTFSHNIYDIHEWRKNMCEYEDTHGINTSSPSVESTDQRSAYKPISLAWANSKIENRRHVPSCAVGM